ncbi:ATP-binding protein [Streptomyces sp. NPDC059740]|uniref:ATP-binding protein n=1 Tax=Streptomyces sp. NPDC059740 TaxID=3346926 RepID=UPI00364F8344
MAQGHDLGTTDLTRCSPGTSGSSDGWFREAGYVPSSSHARELAHGFLERLRERPAARSADAVMLVVSELVTNALVHAGGVTWFRIAAHPDGVEVTVRDRSRVPPRERISDPKQPGGFGWPMVKRLCSEVGVALRPSGKDVRALVPV